MSDDNSNDKKKADGETTSIELISTQVLKNLLATDDDALDSLQLAASGSEDGVLARDENGRFELLEKTSLDSLMNQSVAPTPRPDKQIRRKEPGFGFAPSREESVRQVVLPESSTADELELVNTAMLRVIIDEKLVEAGKEPKYAKPDPKITGRNPYDSDAKPTPSDRAAHGAAKPPVEGFNPYDSAGKKPRR